MARKYRGSKAKARIRLARSKASLAPPPLTVLQAAEQRAAEPRPATVTWLRHSPGVRRYSALSRAAQLHEHGCIDRRQYAAAVSLYRDWTQAGLAPRCTFDWSRVLAGEAPERWSVDHEPAASGEDAYRRYRYVQTRLTAGEWAIIEGVILHEQSIREYVSPASSGAARHAAGTRLREALDTVAALQAAWRLLDHDMPGAIVIVAPKIAVAV